MRGVEERLQAALEVAREAGTLAGRYFADLGRLTVESKGVQDPVSEADRAVERQITGQLQARFPGDSVLGEEYGGEPGDKVWVVDPIDGTANFVRGLPLFCVSIAWVNRGRPELGVIHDPLRDELYAARRGHGATCNGRPIRVRPVSEVSGAILGTGFSRRQPLSHYTHLVERVLGGKGEYRRLGSAALALAWTAAGRLDGFFETHTNAWDVLAGLVLVREAGGWSNDFLAADGLNKGGPVLACPPGLRGLMLDLARELNVTVRE